MARTARLLLESRMMKREEVIFMRSVLIVDDETPSRELIKMSLDWGAFGFDPIFEARNGREALVLFEAEKPSLIITDIQMPVMDGLELIRAVRAISPSQPVVILSCHERFSYAKEALRLGVIDYILKDSFTGSTLVDMLARLDALGGEKDMPKPLSSQALESALRGELLSGEDRAALEGRDYFVMAISRPDSFGDLDLPPRALWSALSETGGQAAYKSGRLYALGFLPRLISGADQLRKRVECLSAVRLALEKPDQGVTIGVSEVLRSPERLCDGVNQATDALQSAVFQGRGRNLYYEAGVPGSKAQLKALDDGVARVREALKSGDEALLVGEVRRLYQRELQGMMQYNYLSHVNALLMGILTQTCLAGDIPFRSIFGADTVSLEALDEMDAIADICGWFVDRFSALSRAVSTSYSPRLSQIIRYIDQHYCEDLTLEGLASTFLIHKVYLAKVFKAETGLSVGEYIRNKRMERAQAMLAREDVRIGEVVDKLGFHNAQTFYNLFKRCVGMSPSEYKALCEMRRVNQSISQSKEDAP